MEFQCSSFNVNEVSTTANFQEDSAEARKEIQVPKLVKKYFKRIIISLTQLSSPRKLFGLRKNHHKNAIYLRISSAQLKIQSREYFKKKNRRFRKHAKNSFRKKISAKTRSRLVTFVYIFHYYVSIFALSAFARH